MKAFIICLCYAAGLGVLSFFLGRLLPKHWLRPDKFPFRTYVWEERLWKALQIRKWQAKVPDMSRLFKKLMPAKALTQKTAQDLPLMIQETCVAELTHGLLCFAGLMLRSGNDAAVALAIAAAGSTEAFVRCMNEKAQALGLTNTHFENPNGLDGEAHYSTARDLAKLSVCAMQNETFRAVVSSKSFTENGRSFTNHNKLLWRVDGADGIKTGYTKQAGRILAGSAVRGGRRLVCVTICDPDDWRDQQALFDYGISAFSLQTLVREGDTVGSVPVVGGRLERVSLAAAEEISYPLAEGEQTELVLHAPQLAFAPVLAGQAGWLELRVSGVCVREAPVYYVQAVEETRPARSFWKRMFGG